MAPMLIETEPTPNPATLKFLPGQTVMDAGTRDFANPEEAEASPLAEALFDLGDVEGVQWMDLKPQVLGVLLDHFSAGAPLFRPGTAAGIEIASEDIADDPEDADIVAQIKELIETRVRPAVARDGGDIVYRGFQRGTVYLAMHGACSGCPSSTATLKQGIETLLKHYVPEVTEVRAA
jgi:Fe-S cluster biogenesis protein NfuA